MRPGPLERRQKAAVLGNVVGGDADRLGELFDERSIGVFDADAVSRRARVSPRSTVDVGDDRVHVHCAEWLMLSDVAGAAAGRK